MSGKGTVGTHRKWRRPLESALKQGKCGILVNFFFPSQGNMKKKCFLLRRKQRLACSARYKN